MTPALSGIDPASVGQEEAEPGLLDDPEDAPLADGESNDGSPARPVRRRRYVPPSSVGFSCYVRGEVRLGLTASAAVYEGTGERGERGRFQSPEYTRTLLPEQSVGWSSAAVPGESGEAIWEGWEGRAGIDVRARPHGDGLILTVTLCNRRGLNPDAPLRERTLDRVGKALFEARIECVVESGELVEYPRVDPSLLTEEEQELELQYRKQRIYAIGHGAAANWEVKPGRPARVWSDFMPEAEVPMMTADTGGDDAVFNLARLAESPATDDLAHFADGYSDWIAEQRRGASALRIPVERATADRVCDRMSIALGRMRRCVEMLRADPLAAESFRLANRAMLDQMRQIDRVAGRETGAGGYRWRPFQLAFLLTTMESATREDDDFRDVLDLIWFPTGGGKTEAYLGLVAFLIVWRRLKYPDSGGGTVAFMRYTLRLLTRQQFERAARMICALELIRRRDPARLGEAPIDIGIWVGREISPNAFHVAGELVEKIRGGDSEARYALLLERCPWCGTALDAGQGYQAQVDDFRFHCVDPACAFGADDLPLPCNVVDEALYQRPPSLLVATIDKFARLAWDERTGAFFGADTGSRPPELVIQDELHLITGPLGSVAGLYEAGLDTLLVRRGVRPKYVASTATIRMAEEQVQRLYGRDLAVFPPPGLSHDDSYFARTDRERPGRLYVGYLAPMLDQQHCLAPLAAALLAAPRAVFEGDADREALLDAWWTQVVYHGSLKGVGNSHNAFVTDVRDFGQRLASELEEERRARGRWRIEPRARRDRRRRQPAPAYAPRPAHEPEHRGGERRDVPSAGAPPGERRLPRRGARDEHGIRRPRRRAPCPHGPKRPAAYHRGVHPGFEPGRPGRRPRPGLRQLLPPPSPEPLPLRELPVLSRIVLPLRRAEQRDPLHVPGPDPRPALRPRHRAPARLRRSARQRLGGKFRTGIAGSQGGARGACTTLRARRGRVGPRSRYGVPHRASRRGVA